ncbi:MAG: methyltransferase domain-containing protein [Carboxydocellales bacterium]
MKKHIHARYTIESSNSCNLSCGNNLDFVSILPGEDILDLGCGNGKEAIQAAMLTGTAGTVVGLDITQAMLDNALHNSKETGISNIRFVKGDIECLPFANAVFDAVISNCVINHASNKLKVYQEIFRVLKKEGRFIVSDAVTKTPLPVAVKEDPENWAQCFGGAVTEEEYLETIRSVGFKKIEILKRRDYIKNGYDFISLTIKANK